MDNDKLTTALEIYAQRDNSDRGGKVVELTLEKDFNEDVRWSSDKWHDDGTPVTKSFRRNPEIPLFVPRGTKLRGVTYLGRVSGQLVFDFYYGSTWYSLVGAESLFESRGSP